MAEILFFPWLQIREIIAFYKFELIPYCKGKQQERINPKIQEILDNQTRFYLKENKTIYSGTLLAINNKIEVEVDKSLEEELNLIIELIAFCGLSSREFFSNGMNYCNKDNFHLKRIFLDDTFLFRDTTRRRDGSVDNLIPAKDFREQKPNHVYISTVNIEKELLFSLILARDSEKWLNIFDGILNFNFANTDSCSFNELIEIVLLVSAFERLLNTKNKEYILANKFDEKMQFFSNIEIKECKKIQANDRKSNLNLKKEQYVRQAWIKDFYRLRGSLAHGNYKEKYPSVWSEKEHLLLGSFIFPLVLKIILSEKNLYSLSKHDDSSIELFEQLLCLDTLNSWRDEWALFLLKKGHEQSSKINLE